MQMQSYNMEGLSQANAVLTSSNSAVTEKLVEMNVMMNAIQA